jgi:hypothetical protein
VAPSAQLKRKIRLIFWPLFLLAAGIFGRHIWTTRDPLHKNPFFVASRARWHLKRLQSRDAKAAGESWVALERLYLTSWQAFHFVGEHFLDEEPIHFQLVLSSGRFWPRTMIPGEPHGETGPSSCKTVGESLLAMAHNENPRWPQPFQGDWQKWFTANRNYYPLSARQVPHDVERGR